MAITSAFCNQAKLDFLGGVHQPGDSYKLALYTSAASLDKTTTAYTATGEVANGSGYTTGGVVLGGYSRALSGDTAYLNWTSNVVLTSASFTARGAMIYNASRGNAAIAVYDLGQDVTATNGTWTATMPANGTAADVRIA